jgi:hypothetical protein
MRLKTAFDNSFNNVLKFRFRRTCCHVDDHEILPVKKHLANSNWQIAKQKPLALSCWLWLLAIGPKSKSFIAVEGFATPSKPNRA